MKIRSIWYTPDCVLKIWCNKTNRNEIDTLKPEGIYSIIVFYTISLRDKTEYAIHEAYRLNKQRFNVQEEEIFLSFGLEDLHSTQDCKIVLHSLIFVLNSKNRMKISIEKAFYFEEILQNPKIESYGEKIPIKKTSNVQDKNITEPETTPEKNDTIQLFKNSYAQFKEKIKNTPLYRTLTQKIKSMDFKLKEFGISILCRLLILLSDLNLLLENDHQQDLSEFLKQNILELTSEVVVT